MACSACENALKAEDLSTDCAQATVIAGATPTTNYWPYLLAGIGSIAFLFLITSGNRKSKPLKAPDKNKL